MAMPDGCRACGSRQVDFNTMAIKHHDDCPWHPDKAPKPLAQERAEQAVALGFAPGKDMGTIVSTLGARRFERETHPMKVSASDALEAAKAWLDAGNEATHILIVVGTELNEGGDVQTKFFQAGTYNVHAQIGLAARMTDALIHGERT